MEAVKQASPLSLTWLTARVVDQESEWRLISNVCHRYRVESTEASAGLEQSFLRIAAFQTRDEKGKKALAAFQLCRR